MPTSYFRQSRFKQSKGALQFLFLLVVEIPRVYQPRVDEASPGYLSIHRSPHRKSASVVKERRPAHTHSDEVHRLFARWSWIEAPAENLHSLPSSFGAVRSHTFTNFERSN